MPRIDTERRKIERLGDNTDVGCLLDVPVRVQGDVESGEGRDSEGGIGIVEDGEVRRSVGKCGADVDPNTSDKFFRQFLVDGNVLEDAAASRVASKGATTRATETILCVVAIRSAIQSISPLVDEEAAVSSCWKNVVAANPVREGAILQITSVV
jgi:hypothetical protein